MYDRAMAFDGAGKPYRSGPSWRVAIFVIVVTIVLVVLGLGVVFPLLLGD